MSESESTAMKLAMSFMRLKEELSDLQQDVKELKKLLSKVNEDGPKGKSETGTERRRT